MIDTCMQDKEFGQMPKMKDEHFDEISRVGGIFTKLNQQDSC